MNCPNCQENHRGAVPMYKTPISWDCTRCHYRIMDKEVVARNKPLPSERHGYSGHPLRPIQPLDDDEKEHKVLEAERNAHILDNPNVTKKI